MDQAPAFCKYSKRVILKSILGQSDGGLAFLGRRVVVGGWVKSSWKNQVQPSPPPEAARDVQIVQSRFPIIRSISKVLGGGGDQPTDHMDSSVHHKQRESWITILKINDGSCVASLPVTVDSSVVPPAKVEPVGTCIMAEGIVQLPSVKGKHIIELKADKIHHIGEVDANKYPLSKRVDEKYLREYAHFRARTPIVASVMRIRNGLTQATHTFFQKNEFLHVQAPIITSTGIILDNSKTTKSELFQVTTLSPKEMIRSESKSDEIKAVVDEIKTMIKEKEEELQQYSKGTEEAVEAAQFINKRKVLLSQLEPKDKTTKSSRLSRGADDDKYKVSEDFFSRKTFLTSSGRLHLESYAYGFGNVYSFGPRFQASQIEKDKLLSEEWKVEVEVAFSQVEDALDCAIDFLKYVCKWILENSTEDIKYLSKTINDNANVDLLRLIAYGNFERISYSDAVALLMKKVKFEKIEWGAPLSEEHERCLTNEIFNKKPVVIYNHPKDMKPFYTRLNDDEKTVASFDVIVPKVGALIRGTQNENRFDILAPRIKEMAGLAKEYEWYLDLRRHGSVKCSGFTFLFDILLLCATGLNDVRDVVPFPRSFGKANN